MFKVTWKAFVVILILVGILAAVLLPAFSRAHESARRSSCQNNLKQMGLVMKMFCDESKGNSYPPVSSVPDNWIMDMQAIYPEYLTDPQILICPSGPFQSTDTFRLQRNLEHPGAEIGAFHPDCVTSLFCNYTGYAIFSDEQAVALYEAYQALPAGVFGYQDLQIVVPSWPNSERPESPGVEGFPVVWDRVATTFAEFNHVPGGSNVLFNDGHVEFIRYSHYNATNNFPLTRIAAETFGSGTPQVSPDCYSAGG